MATDVVDYEGSISPIPRADISTVFDPNSSFYSTIVPETFEDRVNIIKAIDNAEPLSEHLGESFNLVHWIAHTVDIMDDQTGQTHEAIRTVLITDKGKYYAAVSEGIVSSLQNIRTFMGHPDSWPNPIPVKAIEQKSRKGFRYMTLAVG